MVEARLITIPFSHYCEKARWVLDATRLPYREDPHAPLAHFRATRAVGGKTVPILVHGARVLRDSTDIARYADEIAPLARRLIPANAVERAEVLALEDEIDQTIGVEARRLVYWHLLGDDQSAREFAERLLGFRRRITQTMFVSVFRPLVFRRYAVTEAKVKRAEDRIRSLFERLAPRVGEDRYLVGQSFTLADLTLASLAAPLLAPPEHPITGKARAPSSPALAALRADLSAGPVGRHALRMYRAHRASA